MGVDPVADKSGFLCMYMSNHPDTLVSYVRYWGKVKEQVTTAKMTAIDTNGMSFTYQIKGSTVTKEVRVEFDPPLAGYQEVKPRLMNMKGEAEEYLGMIRAPQVTSFHYHSKMLTTALPVAFLLWLTLAPYISTKYAPLFAPAILLRSIFPPWAVSFSWGFLFLCHGLESLYILHRCIKHQTGLIVGAQYVLGTLLLGFPVISLFRAQVQTARIESIMKGK